MDELLEAVKNYNYASIPESELYRIACAFEYKYPGAHVVLGYNGKHDRYDSITINVTVNE